MTAAPDPEAPDLGALTEQVFRSAEAGDWERFASFFGPEARIRQNVGREQSVAESLVTLPRLTADGTTLRYDNARRLVGESSVTEMHDAVFTKPDGRVISLDICVVIQFDDAGLITRVDEYLDSRAAAALAG